jgi:hypothetical protein
MSACLGRTIAVGGGSPATNLQPLLSFPRTAGAIPLIVVQFMTLTATAGAECDVALGHGRNPVGTAALSS